MSYAKLAVALLCLAASAAAGTLSVGNGTADIPQGTQITVRAAPPPSGKVFDRWIGDTAGLDDPFLAEATLTMPAGPVTLTSTYKDDPDLPPPPPPPPVDLVAVQPAVETDGVGDPDDMWLWEHPTSRGDSVLLAADKSRRQIVRFDLQGNLLGVLAEPGRPNNIDGRGDVFGASLRASDQIGLYTVDPTDGGIFKENAFAVGLEPYGFCLYESPTSGKLYAFVSGARADIEQYELDLTSYTGRLVRSLDTPKVEGMAAHDASGRFFYAEEDGALRVIGAEPTDGTASTAIASVADSNLAGDLEGVTTVADLYLIVSVQGLSEYAVYDLAAPGYAWRGNFEIRRLDGPIDSVTSTDGIAWHGGSFNSMFPAGIFFAHDSRNSGGLNMKAVPWERIAAALGLQTP